MAFTVTNPESTEDLVHVSIPILKWEQDEDGDLVIKGVATDGTVDSDDQVVDPAWSAKALDAWISTGGNVRMSHDPRHPVGKGLQVEVDKDGSGKHWVKSLIVDPLAQKLIRKGVLTAYSIGIARPVIKHDPSGRARGGIITGGELAELSVVDRPSNKSSYLEIAKSAADGTCEFTGKMFADDETVAKFAGSDLVKGGTFSAPADMTIEFTPNDLMKIVQSKVVEKHYDELAAKAVYDGEAGIYKRDIDTATRRSLASEGNALPDGSYPIANAEDLHNASVLARSGHGNAEGAKRLIARRAKELGVSNPLDSGSPEKGAGVTDAVTTGNVVTDDVIKEAEPVIIKDPADEKAKKAKKPGGKKKMPPWMQDDSKGDADDKSANPESCKLDHAHTEKCMPSGTPQSASGAKDAAPMQEIPNTTNAPESPMPAGRKTPDTKGMGMSPEASAMLRFKSIGIDTDLGRLHDLTCPAFHPDDVAKYHPFADFTTVIDTDLWQRKALDAACGQLDKAMEMTKAWQAAQLLKNADAADLNDYRLEMHKAFRDANPGPVSYPSPGSMSPSGFKRPCITDGHAANSPGHDGPNTSAMIPDTAPNATSFGRPPLSSGHQSPGPSFMKGDYGLQDGYPDAQGVPTTLRYGQMEKDNARRALAQMHDHLSHQFPLGCPMVEQDMYRQPAARTAPPTEGLATSAIVHGKSADNVTIPDDSNSAHLGKGMRKKLGKKVLAGKMTVDEARTKLGRKVTQKAQLELADLVEKGVLSVDEARAKMGLGPWQEAVTKSAEPALLKSEIVTLEQAFSPDIIKSAIAEAIAPLVAKVEEQQRVISEQEARWETAANLPDPKTASFSGLALNPVFKSARPAGVATQAEIAERTQQMIKRQLYHTSRTSENPAEREAAYAELSRYGITE